MSLAAASRSELTKQFSTAGWWIIAIVLVAYIGMTASGLAWVFAQSASGSDGPALAGGTVPGLVYSIASSIGYVFPLLVGTLMVTAEFRHQTLTPTFLATPRRGVALAGKVVAGVVMGAIFAAVALVSTVGPGAGILAASGIDPAFGSADTWALLGRIALALVLWTLLGIGIGTLVRNQVAAVVIVLAFTQFVEPIARVASAAVKGLADVTKFLPASASDALVGRSLYGEMMGAAATGSPLTWWAGGIVLVGYAVVLLVLGYLVSWRRDVS